MRFKNPVKYNLMAGINDKGGMTAAFPKLALPK
jgi:hypothetical protein